MTLEIISPEHASSQEIAWIEMDTADGNIIIHRGHAPTIYILQPNTTSTFKLKTGKQQTVSLESGIAAIERDTVQLIIQQTI